MCAMGGLRARGPTPIKRNAPAGTQDAEVFLVGEGQGSGLASPIPGYPHDELVFHPAPDLVAVSVVQASEEISVRAHLVRTHFDISSTDPIRTLAGAQGAQTSPLTGRGVLGAIIRSGPERSVARGGTGL
jgi:hypothetical protein